MSCKSLFSIVELGRHLICGRQLRKVVMGEVVANVIAKQSFCCCYYFMCHRLATGSDPAAQLLRFAKELRGSTLHLDIISLGRGQGPRAEELILKAQILKGRWIFLQNCHLAASWMPRLQAIVDRLVVSTALCGDAFTVYVPCLLSAGIFVVTHSEYLFLVCCQQGSLW